MPVACLDLEGSTFPSVPYHLCYGSKKKGGNWELAVREGHLVGMAFVTAVRLPMSSLGQNV